MRTILQGRQNGNSERAKKGDKASPTYKTFHIRGHPARTKLTEVTCFCLQTCNGTTEY